MLGVPSVSVRLWLTVSSEGCRLTLTCANVSCVHVGTCVMKQCGATLALCDRVLVTRVRHEINLLTYFGYTCPGESRAVIDWSCWSHSSTDWYEQFVSSTRETEKVCVKPEFSRPRR